MKLIHLTDPHFVAPGLSLYGLDPRARLDAAVADINRHHGDASLAVITGDLAHWGEPAAYQNLRDCLARLDVPVTALIGNHDDRLAFREVFPKAPADRQGFVQGSLATRQGRLLFLDTNQPGTHAGWYCERRLAWLERRLAESRDRLFLFMHHPPFAVGMASLDRIGLVQREAFRAVVEPHAGRIRHLFYGHVHRPISGSWLGIPATTIRGTNHQVWLELSNGETADDGRRLTFSYEEPAYAVALIDDDSVLVHAHDYLYRGGVYASAAQATPEEERAYALGFEPGSAAAE